MSPGFGFGLFVIWLTTIKNAPKCSALVLSAMFSVYGGNARAQVTLDIINNFAEAKGATYFDGHIENQDVYLYFTGIGASDVTYNGGTEVTAGSHIQFSTVTGGTFSLSSSISGARVYAILGSSAPATIPVTGPDPVDVPYPYSFIEFSTAPGGKADQSFLNQVSFPTRLSNGTKTNSWSTSATAQSVATAFHAAFPSAPYAPQAGAAPDSGAPYSPYAPTTVTRSAGTGHTPINGHRVVAASNVNLPAASPPNPTQLGTGYTNVPGFNNYLGWLKDNQPTEGWKFGYNSPGFPNSTYVGFLDVAGTADNYGLELSGFTYGGTFSSEGNITGGTSVTGTIIYASNNSTQDVFGATYTGNWTDMTIFGATNPAGTVVTTTGDLGSLEVASVLYTVSASIGPGILGSDTYLASGQNTNHFFETGFTAANAVSHFFANSKFDGSSQTGFYDQYWFTMIQAGGAFSGTYAGYFTPYDDHFVGLDVLMSSDSGTLTWELGGEFGAVPEPSAIALLTITGLGIALRRRGRKQVA